MGRYLSIAFAALSIFVVSLFGYAITVGPSEIQRDAVRGKHIKSNAVKGSEIASGAVKSSEIRNGTIKAKDIADGAVNGAKIADRSIDTEDLADEAVNATKIAARAVGTMEIADGAVTVGKLATAVAVAHTPTSSDDFVVEGTETIKTLTVKLPGSGSVLVFASGSFFLNAEDEQVSCSITKGTSTEDHFLIESGGDDLGSGDNRDSFTGMRGFDESSGGTVTYKLVCENTSGSPSAVNVLMSAIYSPSNITMTPVP